MVEISLKDKRKVLHRTLKSMKKNRCVVGGCRGELVGGILCRRCGMLYPAIDQIKNVLYKGSGR